MLTIASGGSHALEFETFERAGMKQFLRGHQAQRQALRVMVAQERL